MNRSPGAGTTRAPRRAGAEEFRAAMARFPAGVVVVTTRDEVGTPRGFTASSFCSVSMDPPLVLVCLGNSSDSYAAFERCRVFAISVLRPEQRAIAVRFATKGVDKFADGGLTVSEQRLPAVADALCELGCTVYDRHPAGDHMILVGEVTRVRLGGGEPVVYYDRSFRSLAAPDGV